MLDSLQRIIENHSRSSPTHHSSHALTHIRFIAVNRTFLTCRFLFSKFTSVQTHLSILQQLGTIGAKTTVLFISTAIKSDHQLYSLLFILNPTHGIIQSFLNKDIDKFLHTLHELEKLCFPKGKSIVHLNTFSLLEGLCN